MNRTNFIIILILILVIFIINYSLIIENFPINTYKFPIGSLFDSWYSDSNEYTDNEWNNIRLGNTRNMSYDIRGDPLEIPVTNFVWNNATTFPIYNAPP